MNRSMKERSAQSVALGALLAGTLLAGVASAKGGTPQNHHCVKDGTVLPGKTRKECKKEGGSWEKDGPAASPAGEHGKPEEVEKPASK